MKNWINNCHFGDCRDTMRLMIADGVKVQTCVTSPPYYGLRDYGHDGQLGLESTPDEYVAAMVDVFRCVRELLADDGTLWLNIGDSYCSTDKWGGGGNVGKNTVAPDGSVPSWAVRRKRPHLEGIKPKDLMGIPWMLAFALRTDGWHLRSEVIWSKGNAMPESVTDRPTRSHETIFLLAKSERYHYDHEAIKEPSVSDHASGNGFKRDARLSYRDENGARGNDEQWSDVGGDRNRRTVWNINTQPYKGAHFAVFPTALVEPCVLAGARVGDIVLDPFFGSGTTGQVASSLGRGFIGCELNREYEPLQRDRLRQPGLMLEIA